MAFRKLLLATFFLCAVPSLAAADDTLEVGFGRQDVTPQVGAPLGGFGARRLGFPFFDIFNEYPLTWFFRPSDGITDSVRAKAFLLKKGDRKLLFISLDVVGVMREVYEDLVQRLEPMGFKREEVFISATHTHSGPGSIVDNLFWGVVIMDRFNGEIYDPFSKGVLNAVQLAKQSLEPGELSAFSFTAQNLQRNRRNKVGQFDPQANVLLARSSQGHYLGAMVNLPIHGTAFGSHNMKFSADVPGGIERSFEARLIRLNQAVGSDVSPQVLFVNGAEGDVAPIQGGQEGIDRIGESFAEQAMQGLPSARPIESQWSVKSAMADVGGPGLYLKVCSSGWVRDWIYSGLNLDLNLFLPDELPISLIRLGDIAMFSWPGEATTSLGLASKALALEAGASQAWVLGLTNDYVAYFTNPAEFDEASYESCNSLYGREGGELLVQAQKDLLK